MIETVGPGHPSACQACFSHGPCPNLKSPHSDYCDKHQGFMATKTVARASLNNYIINSQYGQRAAEMARNPQFKNLTDEVTLVRVALETLFRKIKTDDDMLVYSERIIALTGTIQKLMESCQKIQERNKDLLDRATIFAIANDILAIMACSIDDVDLVAKMGDEIYESIIARISRPDEINFATQERNKPLALGTALSNDR